MRQATRIHCDFLVIGSGLAGLLAALRLEPFGRVILITKKDLGDGATAYAQGGIAAVTHGDDSFDSHIQDTLVAGAGLCEEKAVRLVVTEGPSRVLELIDWGVRFTLREKSGDAPETFDLGLEGGHSHRRILHVADRTGRAIHRALIRRIRSSKGIRCLENHFAVDLLTHRNLSVRPKGCYGAYVLDPTSEDVIAVIAGATVLATGGAGKTYLYTSNPDVATGDGMAMAFRAGVPLGNLEFVQFHPTCLYHPQAKSFLISEAVRGEGGILKLRDGQPFMARYHSQKELAPRDIVARAIDNELKKRDEEHVYLDIRRRKTPFIRRRFPEIYKKCLEFGIDITKEPIPVVPAAHYFCGGVKVNEWGETTLPGLFAAGEVTYTGLHGANRLASNSLLECVVYAHRVAEKARQTRVEFPRSLRVPAWASGRRRDQGQHVIIAQNWDEVRRMMWNYVGIERSDQRLTSALRRSELVNQEIENYFWNFQLTPELMELRNVSQVADLVIRSALTRKESRGLHFNRDHPRRDDRLWKKVTTIVGGEKAGAPPRVTFRAI